MEFEAILLTTGIGSNNVVYTEETLEELAEKTDELPVREGSFYGEEPTGRYIGEVEETRIEDGELRATVTIESAADIERIEEGLCNITPVLAGELEQVDGNTYEPILEETELDSAQLVAQTDDVCPGFVLDGD